MLNEENEDQMEFVIDREELSELLSNLNVNPKLEQMTESDLEIVFPSNTQLIWKIVIVGDGAVGKTSIRRRFIGQGFDPMYLSTIGADFSTQTLRMGERRIKYQIWDLAGQPQFADVRKGFYSGALGALVVYDITNRDSFRNLELWIQEIWKHCGLQPIPFILLANKSDLAGEGMYSIPEKYPKLLVEKHSKKTLPNYGFGVKYLKTSAKTGANIKLAFQLLTIQLFVQRRFRQLKSQS